MGVKRLSCSSSHAVTSSSSSVVTLRVVDLTGASWNRFQRFIQWIDTLRLAHSMAPRG